MEEIKKQQMDWLLHNEVKNKEDTHVTYQPSKPERNFVSLRPVPVILNMEDKSITKENEIVNTGQQLDNKRGASDRLGVKMEVLENRFTKCGSEMNIDEEKGKIIPT